MAVSEKKKRVQITFGEDMLSRIDAYCEKTGLSRSAFVCASVAAQLYGSDLLLERAASAVEETFPELAETYRSMASS